MFVGFLHHLSHAASGIRLLRVIIHHVGGQIVALNQYRRQSYDFALYSGLLSRLFTTQIYTVIDIRWYFLPTSIAVHILPPQQGRAITIKCTGAALRLLVI
jgi:hypothetical protein